MPSTICRHRQASKSTCIKCWWSETWVRGRPVSSRDTSISSSPHTIEQLYPRVFNTMAPILSRYAVCMCMWMNAQPYKPWQCLGTYVACTHIDLTRMTRLSNIGNYLRCLFEELKVLVSNKDWFDKPTPYSWYLVNIGRGIGSTCTILYGASGGVGLAQLNSLLRYDWGRGRSVLCCEYECVLCHITE